jgi:para-nitrobenzyl esterase
MALNPVVSTRTGKLEGLRRRGVRVFRGIPYAEPPRGALRFQAPLPPKPWTGVRSGRRFGPAAPQLPPAMLLVRRAIGAAASQQSQDCLYLNVWAPPPDARPRPVMVWIHGGAFVLGAGSSTLYDGAQLARTGGVVVVTINYRLGALGFLDLSRIHPGKTVANLGIRDQIAALEWVRDNIEAFGGDPENVTVFGESAGGMSVGTLLGTPAAKGLFARAILQSGATSNVSSPEQAARVSEAFLDALGARDLAQLEQASVSALLAAQRDTTMRLTMGLGTMAWQPSVAGDLIPEPPLAAIERGAAGDVSILVGTNRDEWKLFQLADRRGRNLDEDGLRRRLARSLPDCEVEGGRAIAQHAIDSYRAALVSPRGEPTPSQIWEAFQSDRIFHYPAERLAELQSAHAPTYRYLFGWSPPALRERMGACHGMEIPFVFGTLRDPSLRALSAFAPYARRLSDHMQGAWLAFAAGSEPGHEELPAWPAFAGEGGATMLFTRRARVEEGPLASRLHFWRGLES